MDAGILKPRPSLSVVRQHQRQRTIKLGIGLGVVPGAMPNPGAGVSVYLHKPLNLKAAQMLAG
ncbi:MAG: hypothetical protein ACXW4Z_10430, partial [Candidatus Binatia bacterium]